MSSASRLRQVLLWTSFSAALVLFGWAGWVAFLGGFDRVIAGYRLRTNDPYKPLLDAAIALSIYLLAGGRVPRWLTAIAAAVRSIPLQLDTMDRAGDRRRVMALGAAVTVAVTAAMTFGRPRVMPIHDTIQIFEVFYYFYSHVVSYHALPHWAPYGVFGVPFAPWSIIALSPSNYLATAVGWALGISDVLTAFRLSVCFELLIFAFGTVALLVRLGLRPSVAWFATCALVIGTSWSTQLWWNFRIIYMVPLVLFFLVRFFEDGRAANLGLAALAEIAGMVGNLSYFAPLHLLVVGLAGIVLMVRARRTFRLAPEPRVWRAGLIAVWAAAALAGWVLLTRGTMQPLVPPPGHRPGDMSVPIDIYLTWAVNASLGDTMRMLARGWPLFVQAYPDNSVYLGPFTLFFFVWGFVFARDRFGFRLSAGLSVFLIWLSFAGVLAWILYFVPTFSVFRHLGLLLSAAQVFIVAAAAWGIEHFLAQARAKHVWWLIAGIWLLFDASLTPDQILTYYRWWVWGSMPAADAHLLWRAGLASGLLAAVLVISSGLRRWPWHQPLGGLAWIVALVWIVDVSAFAAFRSSQLPTLSAAQETEFHSTLQVRAPRYAERRAQPDDEAVRAQNLLEVARSSIKPLRTTAYGSFDLWSENDACRGVDQDTFVLMTTRDAVAAADRHESPLLDALVRCEGPKLRLVPAAALTAGAARADGRPIAGEIRGEHFTANTVAVTVRADAPAVLLYADATSPEWRARVDGQPQPMIAAFGAFKAVEVAAGSHRVEFEYAPRFGLTGVEWLTLASAAFVLCLLGVAVRWVVGPPQSFRNATIG